MTDLTDDVKETAEDMQKIKEIIKLKKQLAIAVEWLKEHAEDKDCWEDIRDECKLILKQIRKVK